MHQYLDCEELFWYLFVRKKMFCGTPIMTCIIILTVCFLSVRWELKGVATWPVAWKTCAWDIQGWVNWNTNSMGVYKTKTQDPLLQNQDPTTKPRPTKPRPPTTKPCHVSLLDVHVSSYSNFCVFGFGPPGDQAAKNQIRPKFGQTGHLT
jgi:hypothetical protein